MLTSPFPHLCSKGNGKTCIIEEIKMLEGMHRRLSELVQLNSCGRKSLRQPMLYTEWKKEWWTIMKEYWDRNIFFYKNITLSLLLEKSPKFCVRKTGRQRTWTQAGRGLLYWPFLRPHSDFIFKDLLLCFLDERFLHGITCVPLLPYPGGHPGWLLPWLGCGSNWLTVTDCDPVGTCVYKIS